MSKNTSCFYKKKRFSITLIEMIVVMILIATITGALAYNYRESLNEGKAFKTKEGISRIEAIINIYLAEHPDTTNGVDWRSVIAGSSLVKDPDTFLLDGWGKPYDIKVEQDQNGDTRINVQSQEYDRYKKNRGLR